MSKQTKNILISAVIGLAVIAGIVYLVYDANRPGELDEFATCLKDKGAVFYGAFWCPVCKKQKTMFGNSARLLPYFECSLPDGRGQNQACNDKKIEKYPTWEFSNGNRDIGEIPLKTLAERTGCVLPRNY